jgi:hypothetical protein
MSYAKDAPVVLVETGLNVDCMNVIFSLLPMGALSWTICSSNVTG